MGNDIVWDALRQYHGNGWALVELHHVTDQGFCSCGDVSAEHTRKLAGKHPVRRGWQTHPLISWPDVHATWEASPRANIGIATGRASGIFVLDFDPHNADGEARRLIGRLLNPHVVTGGSGLHWRFTMPADFEPTNSPGALPAGLDVRGTGGQVVAPPSVSGKGVYQELPARAPAHAAPGWLLELIRPKVREPVASGVLVAGAGQAYALRGIAEILSEVAQLGEGRRNTDGWHRARRIRELAAGAGLDAELWRSAWLEACRANGLPEDEAVELWDVKSTTRPVEPKGPPQPTIIEGAIPEMMPPFGVGEPVSSEPALTPVMDLADLLIAEMVDSRGLREIPPPEWLIEGFLVRDSLARINGRPGSMKSFVVLDMALCVVTGRQWHGREVKQGTVIYILAEGASGTSWRLDAWCQEHGVDPDVRGLRFLPRPVQAKDVMAWAVLVEACRRLAPDMIIIDTQSRVTVGIKENDNSEMGIFVEQAEALRRATGACVQLVHHAGKAGGEDGRGAEVVHGALVTEMAVSRPVGGMRLTVRVTKQKNAPECEINLRAREVDLMRVGELGMAVPSGERSVVLGLDEPVEGTVTALAAGEDVSMPDGAQRLLGLFTGAGPFARGNGGTKAEAKSLFCADPNASKATFYRAWNTLTELKAIGRVDGTQSYRHVPADQRESLSVDMAGEWIIGNT